MAAPGAGFAETAEYAGVWRKEPKPLWFEERLWRWYDATEYALNFYQCPVVAYSGEVDKQKQAADVMAEAMANVGIRLKHVIGPETAHKYHPDSKREIAERLDAILADSPDAVPSKVSFTTWTLRYNEMDWVRLLGLEEHWQRTAIVAEITDSGQIEVATANVKAFELELPPGQSRLALRKDAIVVVDGQTLPTRRPYSDGSWHEGFVREEGRWRLGAIEENSLQKRPGLQGPVDDAFMDSFVFVRPTGAPLIPETHGLLLREMETAAKEWRAQFRGDARVVDDAALTDEEIAEHNLVLWGDPGSNSVLGRILAELPLRWDRRGVGMSQFEEPAAEAYPVLIYPNPLNPERYVVINSGPTFLEYGAMSNSLQTPRLPDYALLSVEGRQSGKRLPETVVSAGFFDESWQP